ncbi:hypothetical protein F1880_006623 [Penicillium rolfsii]|nr:hypothetical protein F1880_006623 [Penicillium rolfsii]
MALKSPRRGNTTECHYWDYSFHWTELHQSSEELHPMIQTYDSLADECVQILNSLPTGENEDRPFKKDLYGLLKKHADENPKLKELWDEVNTVPEWVNWEQIQRGQDVFFRYGVPILNVLGFESLLGGMGAMRVVETLARTGGFGAKVVRRRLLETLQHVLQVNSSAEGMKPGGEGNVSSVRVRLLHASVRLRILSLVEQQPGYYDVAKYGTPVNDLDCIGTINTFCSSVVWLGLPRQGIYLKQQEIEDYIALWRLVAYYMGTPTQPFESTAKARAMMESLLISEIDPTDIGRILAKNIIIGLENTAPSYASKEFLEAMSRLLNGDQLADELDIPQSSLYYRTILWGYCFWVRLVSTIIPKIYFMDRFMINKRRKYFYKILMDEKLGLGGESRFEFKYLPTLTRTTRLGQRRTTKFERPGLESLGHLGLMIAFGAVVTLGIALAFAAKLIPSDQLLHVMRHDSFDYFSNGSPQRSSLKTPTVSPLLLLQPLDIVVSLRRILRDDESTTDGVERVQSYFLAISVVSNIIASVIGPQRPYDGGDTETPPIRIEYQHVSEREGESLTETTSLLPDRAQIVQRTSDRRAHGAIWRWRSVRQIWRYTSLIGALLAQVPAPHRAFFFRDEDESVRNIKRLFTTPQNFLVGCEVGGDSSRTPGRAINITCMVRLIGWPVVKISLIYGLAKGTKLFQDLILWFKDADAVLPAWVISGLAELAQAPETRNWLLRKH